MMPEPEVEKIPVHHLPVALPPKASPARSQLPSASFVSQLIAERQHLPPQRARRRAPVAVALDCYGQTAAHGVRRLPAGYRKTVVV